MQVVAAMRVHDFALTESIVIPALERHVDGFAFLFHPDDIQQNARLTRHWKYGAHAIWRQSFRNAPTQKAALELAGTLSPAFVIALDSDLLLPDRFGDEFENFKSSNRWSMDFYNFECWGDMDHVVADACYRADPHCMVLRWMPGLEIGGYHRAHRFRFWCGKRIYRCPYPMRHLAFMTPELRGRRFLRGMNARAKSNWRAEVEGPRAWAYNQHPAIPYDPDMGWKDYLVQAKRKLG